MILKKIKVIEQPELRFTASGLAICTLCIGNVPCVAFGKNAEDIVQEVVVGDELRLKGYYKTLSWIDFDGTSYDIERFTVNSWSKIK